MDEPVHAPSRGRIFTLAGLFTVDSFGTGLIVQSLVSYWFFTRFGLQPGSLGVLFFVSSVLTAISLWVAARLARRIGLLNTIVFTHIPSSLLLIAVPFVPEAWMAMALWLLRAFFAQMDAPTSQSYTMAVVTPEEHTAMASATTVTRSAGLAAGPSVGTALWTALGPSAPFLVGGTVKIAYDLTLWWMFRRVKPPEEATESQNKPWVLCALLLGLRVVERRVTASGLLRTPWRARCQKVMNKATTYASGAAIHGCVSEPHARCPRVSRRRLFCRVSAKACIGA